MRSRASESRPRDAYREKKTPLDDASTLTLTMAVQIRDRVAALLATEPGSALALSKTLLRRIKPSVEPAARAIAWRAHAEANIYTGRLGSARSAYEKAAELAEAAADTGLLGQILVGQIYVLGMLGEERQSSQLARRAEALLTRVRDDEYLRKLHINRAGLLYHQERFEEARRAYERVLPLFERAGIRDASYVILCMNLAVAHTNLHRWPDADSFFRRAEALADRLDLRFFAAHSRFNRALLERTQGNYRGALPLLFEAETIFEREDARDMRAAVQRARAEIHLELGMVQDAIDGARVAAEMFRAESMELDACLSDTTLGTALLSAGQADAAEIVFAAAEQYFRKKRLRVRACRTGIDRSECALARGDFAAARTRVRRALRGLSDGSAPLVLARGRITMARVLFAEGRYQAAEQQVTLALARRAILPPRDQMYLWKEAAEVSRRRGNRGEATRRLRRAAEALERHRNLVPPGDLRERAFDAGAGIYAALMETMLDGGTVDAKVLLQLAQRARARGFFERAASRGARDGRGVRERSRASLDRQRILLGSLGKELEEKELSGADRKEIAALRKQVKALEQAIIGSKPTFDGPPVRRPRFSRATIGKRRTLIAYYVAERRVVAFVRGGGGDWSSQVLGVSAAEILAEVDRLTFQIDTFALSCVLPDVNVEFQMQAARSILERLFDVLLRPLLAQIPPSDELVFCPHAFLHLVPFECLHDGRDYVDERWAISRVASLVPLPKRQKGRGKGALVCGTERPGLGTVRQEVEAVSGFLPGSDTRVRINPDTASLLDEMELCSTLHWCTHGRFRQDNPGFSSLATGDGSIYLSDLAERDLNADLVVLSACESGRVFLGRGDDLSGVAHGFLAAGAEQLVANQWRIREEATLSWIESFYRTRTEKGDIAQSVRNAGRDTRLLWPHPYYWGGFILHRREI